MHQLYYIVKLIKLIYIDRYRIFNCLNDTIYSFAFDYIKKSELTQAESSRTTLYFAVTKNTKLKAFL